MNNTNVIIEKDFNTIRVASLPYFYKIVNGNIQWCWQKTNGGVSDWTKEHEIKNLSDAWKAALEEVATLKETEIEIPKRNNLMPPIPKWM